MKVPRVLWSARARDDLIAIGRYIAADSPAAARAWVEKLRACARAAALAPLAGRKVPEIERNEIREATLRSYRIVYLVKRGGIEVLTVFEGHRRIPADVFADDDDD